MNTVNMRLVSLLALAVLSVAANKALSQDRVLTFDDLPGVGYPPVTNGYGGLQWSNFQYLDGVNYQPQGGYSTGVVSPNNVAFNGNASPAEISSLTPFRIHSGYFTAAHVEPVQLQVQGFLGGVTVIDNTYTLITSGPTLLSFDFPQIDRVRFSTSAAVWKDGAFYFRDFFAMDNLSVSIIPEPACISLMICCLGVLAFRRLHSP